MVVFNRRLSLSIQHVDDGRSNHAIKPFHHNKDPKMAPCWYSMAKWKARPIVFFASKGHIVAKMEEKKEFSIYLEAGEAKERV